MLNECGQTFLYIYFCVCMSILFWILWENMETTQHFISQIILLTQKFDTCFCKSLSQRRKNLVVFVKQIKPDHGIIV